MINSRTVFAGVSLIPSTTIFCMVSLDGGLRILDKKEGDLEMALAFCLEPDMVVAGLGFARQPNRGVVRSMTHLHAGRGRPASRELDMRYCEALLRRQGLKITSTPADINLCPAWMQQGFAFYTRLQEAGFNLYPADEAPRQMFETHVEGVFRALLGQALLSQRSLEGRLQRQLLLYEQGMRIADPMNFFEEVTRNRLMQGTLPWQTLYSLAELDALACAFTAWRAAYRPNQISQVGEFEEGSLVLPLWKELENSQLTTARQMAIFS